MNKGNIFINDFFDICVVGTGYVGLVTGTCLAEMGHRVICVDNNEEKIKKLQKGISPIYEAGIEILIAKNKKAGRLKFTTNIEEGVKNSDIIFIAVNTPTKENGETDLSYIQAVSEEIAKIMDSPKIIVSKSTMPVESGKKIKETVQKYIRSDVSFDIVSNPEFLREGQAVKDFLNPERIVIGVENKRSEKIMRQVYKKIKTNVIVTNIETAEIIKHACNAFLATKISFINAVAVICEKSGANIDEVARAMGLDKRIGKSFLRAGIGYGGSCLPKDVEAFRYILERQGYEFELLRKVQEINQYQKRYFIKKVEKALGDVKGKILGVLGLAFKSQTDDMRDAPSISIINKLKEKGASIKAYDPLAMQNAKKIFGDTIIYTENIYETARDSDALLVLTDWEEFKTVDLKKIKKLLSSPIVIDGRNIFNLKTMRRLNFYYSSIGRETVL